MYSPTLGRWMQQDPSRYIDGDSLYPFADANPITGRDPDGTLTNKPMTPWNHSECGSLDIKWQFYLEKPAAQHGWIVQEVDQRSRFTACRTHHRVSPDLHLWEAFEVKKGASTDVYNENFFSDHWDVPPKPCTAGDIVINNSLYFFTDDQVKGDNPSTWKTAIQLGAGDSDLPTKLDEPAFWNKPGGAWTEAGKSHTVQVEWDCCNCGVGEPAKNSTVSLDGQPHIDNTNKGWEHG